MSDTEEAELMRRIAKGDETAFADLYSRYEKAVFRFIKGRLGDPHEAADVFHEVMLQIWRAAERFQGRSKLSTWIFGIAHNKTIDLLRKRGRREWEMLEDDISDGAPSAVDRLAAAENAAALRRCIEELDPVKREVVRLVFHEGWRYQEIAEAMACAEGTIKARVHRAVGAVRACVERCAGATGGGSDGG